MSTPPNTPPEPTASPIPAPQDPPAPHPAGNPAQPSAGAPAPGPSLMKGPAPAEAPAPSPAEAPGDAPAEAPGGAPAQSRGAGTAGAGYRDPFAVPAAGGFAPVGGGPGYGGPVAPPAHHWGPPPGYAGYPVAPPAPSNGLAVAALVLTLTAVALAVVPFLFWTGTLAGLVGIGLAIGALVRTRSGAPRRAMAVVGLVLGFVSLGASVGGWFITRAVVHQAGKSIGHARGDVHEDRDDEYFDDPTPAPDPYATPQGPGMSTPLAFGRTYTYPNGIKVTLSVPTEYQTPSEYVDIGHAVRLTFTITNDSAQPHQVIYAMPTVRDDKGAEGKTVFDTNMPKWIQGTIRPGESATGSAAFEVPEGTRSISAQLSPGTLLPAVRFAGPVG